MGCVKASPYRGGGKISDFAGGVIRRGDDPSPGARQWQSSTGSLRGAAKAATWQSVSSLLCSCNLLQYQRSFTAPKAPLCKGGWLGFAETGGLFRRIGPSKVESDYELSDFWTWSSRILRCISNCAASIPPALCATSLTGSPPKPSVAGSVGKGGTRE